MADVLKITNRVSIPLSDIEFTAIRAQGPGGQAVNKTSSAVHIRFDFQNSAPRARLGARLSGGLRKKLNAAIQNL